MKPTLLKYFFIPVLLLLLFQGIGKGEVFSGFGREGVEEMVAKTHVKNLPAHNLDMVDLQTARSIAIQTEALPPGKMVELIKAYSIGDPAQVDFTRDMNRIQGFYVKAAIDARSAGKMDDVATFYAALEKVRKYRKLEPLKVHIDAVSDLWQDANKLDLFIADLAANQNLLDFFEGVDDATRLKYAGAWDKLYIGGFSSSFRNNPINLKQRSILDEWAGNISSATNKQKGNFGEIGADLDLNAKGYMSLQPRIDGIDSPGHNGIDIVVEKNGQYFIVEGKYSGSASLNPANPSTGLDRQMSDAWILADNRLLDALGGNQNLVDEIIDIGYTRVLAKTAPDGSVTYQYVSSTGYLNQGGGPLGVFIP